MFLKHNVYDDEEEEVTDLAKKFNVRVSTGQQLGEPAEWVTTSCRSHLLRRQARCWDTQHCWQPQVMQSVPGSVRAGCVMLHALTAPDLPPACLPALTACPAECPPLHFLQGWG